MKSLLGAIVVSIFAFLLQLALPAQAQSSLPNPLRAAPAAKPAQPAPAASDAVKSPEAKPKRERSAKQKQGDDDMRACGASWRQDKAQLATKGETWRNYLKTCRAERKTARGA